MNKKVKPNPYGNAAEFAAYMKQQRRNKWIAFLVLAVCTTILFCSCEKPGQCYDCVSMHTGNDTTICGKITGDVVSCKNR